MSLLRLVPAVLAVCTIPLSAALPVERQLERTFTAAPDSTVIVNISGGPITVTSGSGRTVEVRLRQVIDTDSNQGADELLADYDISLTQQGSDVELRARRKPERRTSFRRGNSGVRFEATLTVPPDVQLDLHTSGGSIAVRGERTAGLDANTSGGRISVDGDRGGMHLNTSGGSILVGRALGVLEADTSGGGITVDYVAASATDVLLGTSGGSIRVGVDPNAKLSLTASTSGGRVSVEELPFESRSLSRTHLRGTLNGGGGRLRASTSGGSIEVRGVRR